MLLVDKQKFGHVLHPKKENIVESGDLVDVESEEGMPENPDDPFEPENPDPEPEPEPEPAPEPTPEEE
jgi:hypothetical protein